MKHPVRRAVISGLVSLVLAALLYWFWLPPFHPRCPDFWMFLIVCLLIVLVVFSVAGFSGAKAKEGARKNDTVVDFGGTKVHLPALPHLPGALTGWPAAPHPEGFSSNAPSFFHSCVHADCP